MAVEQTEATDKEPIEMATLKDHRFTIESGEAYVAYLPPGESQPPKLIMRAGSDSVTLVPPLNREDYWEFATFVRDLAEGASDLLIDCHPAGVWGRQMFPGVAGQSCER